MKTTIKNQEIVEIQDSITHPPKNNRILRVTFVCEYTQEELVVMTTNIMMAALAQAMKGQSNAPD